MAEPKLDEVGAWTEIKLKILKDYSQAYVKILHKQKFIRHFAYIDGFAGAGAHISKQSGEEIKGSPAIALDLEPEFSFYHFIDMDGQRAERLRKLANGRANVKVYEGDCNRMLLNEVFPQCRYEDFRRALCLLDPYKLNPDWEVVQKAGEMESIEIFLNFMIMDANMNMFWSTSDRIPAAQVERMNKFWGDESWKEAGWSKEKGLFDTIETRRTNEDVVRAYQKRLKEVAGFKYVPDPIPMRNSKGATVYYLFFASHNKAGNKIAGDVFKKYRDDGAK